MFEASVDLSLFDGLEQQPNGKKRKLDDLYNPLEDDEQNSRADAEGVEATRTGAGGAEANAEERDDFGELKTLTDEQLTALENVVNGENVFITGPAGSGKTLLVQCLADLLKEKKIFVMCQTDKAAQQCGGITFHSFCWGHVKSHETIPNMVKELLKHPETVLRLQTCDVVIFDVVESINVEMFDKTSALLKAARKTTKPYGGVQVVAVGDFLGGLGPVFPSSSDYSRYLFQSPVWKSLNFRVVQLTKNFRTNDDYFCTLLERCRRGKLTRIDTDWLKSRIQVIPAEQGCPVDIAAKRADAEATNAQYQEQVMNFRYVEYPAVVQPEQPVRKVLNLDELRKDPEVAKQFPASAKLVLHQSTQVVSLVQQGLVPPGTLGVVQDFGPEPSQLPIVKFDGFPIAQPVAPFTYRKYFPKYGWVLSRRMPLDIAFSMVVRDVQGRTLSSGRMDLENLNKVPGAVYTALSRIVNPSSSLFIQRTPPEDFYSGPDADVLSFYESFEALQTNSKNSKRRSELVKALEPFLASLDQPFQVGLNNPEQSSSSSSSSSSDSKEPSRRTRKKTEAEVQAKIAAAKTQRDGKKLKEAMARKDNLAFVQSNISNCLSLWG